MRTALRPAPSAHLDTAVLPGLGLVALAVGLSWAVAAVLPALSPLTTAVVLGIAVGNLGVLPAAIRPGVKWATRWLLRGGVVLLGTQLAVAEVLALGGGTLVVVLATVVITFAGTVLLGRMLGLPRGLSILVGTGFSICGASAVAAMEGVVDREDGDVATAVALVTVFGSLAMVIMPLLAGSIGLTDVEYGRWVGASVHEVAQVVAAASPVGAAAVAGAVVVKLSRVVLLAPMVAAVGLAERRRGRQQQGKRAAVVPLFVVGFLAMVAVRGTGLLPAGMIEAGRVLSTLLMAGALFGLGTTVRLAVLARTGPRALVLGLCSTLLVAGTSYLGLVLIG